MNSDWAATVELQPILHIEVIFIELLLTSEIPPSVNHYLKYRSVMKHGKPMAMSYKSPEAVKYREEFADYVRSECSKQNWDFIPNKRQHFYVDAVFYFDKISRDCNNYFKVLLDAITDTQLIWLDDNVVCERVQRIYYDAANPRIELRIFPVEYIGVFDNASQMDEFESRCVGCTRYSRNCSILRNAKAGRVQREIKNAKCLAMKSKAQNEKDFKEDLHNGK